MEQTFDGGSLYALRTAVAAHAAAAGLSRARVYDVVVAAHELAANAVRHGAGRGRLQLRVDGALLYSQVSDDGSVSSADQPRTGAVRCAVSMVMACGW
jgi:anti-sigma regulatory factor (Ser/Thr protein kinase)